MDQVISLCHELGFHAEVIDLLSQQPSRVEEAMITRLTDPASYAAATDELETLVDADGMQKLFVMLTAACRTRELYRARGVDDRIFLETMGCFPRFVGEHYASYGRWGFDRAFWVGRQLSMQLFRLGCLEYEMTETDGTPLLSVHIPSDADLTPAVVDASLAAAHRFFASYAPAYADAPRVCHSWLLSPALGELLPSTSRIVQFQQRFVITRTYPDAESYKQWVYGDPHLQVTDFSEKTALQRGIKRYVLAGGKIGEAYGVMKQTPVASS